MWRLHEAFRKCVADDRLLNRRSEEPSTLIRCRVAQLAISVAHNRCPGDRIVCTSVENHSVDVLRDFDFLPARVRAGGQKRGAQDSSYDQRKAVHISPHFRSIRHAFLAFPLSSISPLSLFQISPQYAPRIADFTRSTGLIPSASPSNDRIIRWHSAGGATASTSSRAT